MTAAFDRDLIKGAHELPQAIRDLKRSARPEAWNRFKAEHPELASAVSRISRSNCQASTELMQFLVGRAGLEPATNGL